MRADVVDADLDRLYGILAILVGDRRGADIDAREVHPLVGLEFAAVFHRRDHSFSLDLSHPTASSPSSSRMREPERRPWLSHRKSWESHRRHHRFRGKDHTRSRHQPDGLCQLPDPDWGPCRSTSRPIA